ncbi:unnamed protein product [Rotaria sordida]|uniref:Uncharacterized protein n=1 Tax=Rotaria sordida TaxID=392033 RepID=A0A819MJD4_9BILA|nr:unnamed protein product [Rotaria sordida]
MDSKRFVPRSPNKRPEIYFISANESDSNVSSKIPQPPTLPLPSSPTPTTVQSADVTTPRTEVVHPARRIVVIRNTRHHQSDQGSVDLGEFGRPNSVEVSPAISHGNRSVYLIRRPIAPDSSNSIQFYQTVQEPLPTTPLEHTRTPTTTLEYSRTPTTTLEHTRTPTPPKEIVTSSNQPRSPSPRRSLSLRPKSSKRLPSPIQTETTQHYVPYLRRSRSKVRTPSPVRINSTRQIASSNRQRPPTVKQEELQDSDHQQSFATLYSLTTTTESDNPPSPVTIEHERQAIQNHRTSTSKSLRRIKAASTRTKSAKSIVLINPDDQSIAIIENSYVQGEPIVPVVKYSQSIKQTQFYGRNDDQSSENLLKPSQWPGCLGCLSRHMCLIIVICFFIILIGLAGAGVSAYFLITDSSNDTIPKIVGIVVGGVLAIAALCFLYIVLGCIGSRDGYFTYNDNDRSIGGRAFALIPPSHPNAHLYIPRDYMKLVENNHSLSETQITTRSTSNIVNSRSSLRTPVSIKLYTQQQTMNSSNSLRDGLENKLNKDNITIEMPERLLIGREMSPRSREHSLNQFVKNIGHVVEDAKKRYNGDVPTKFIVQIDKNAE